MWAVLFHKLSSFCNLSAHMQTVNRAGQSSSFLLIFTCHNLVVLCKLISSQSSSVSLKLDLAQKSFMTKKLHIHLLMLNSRSTFSVGMFKTIIPPNETTSSSFMDMFFCAIPLNDTTPSFSLAPDAIYLTVDLLFYISIILKYFHYLKIFSPHLNLPRAIKARHKCLANAANSHLGCVTHCVKVKDSSSSF